MYDAKLYEHHFAHIKVQPRKNEHKTNDSVHVYFESLGKSIPITLRYFDRLLNENSLVCIGKKWISVD